MILFNNYINKIPKIRHAFVIVTFSGVKCTRCNIESVNRNSQYKLKLNTKQTKSVYTKRRK